MVEAINLMGAVMDKDAINLDPLPTVPAYPIPVPPQPQNNLKYVDRLIKAGQTDERFKKLSQSLQNYQTKDIKCGISHWNSIVDFTDTSKSVETFSFQRDVAFLAALSSTPTNVRTRVVVLRDNKSDIFADPKIIDALGRKYEIDPTFFASMSHLSALRESSKKHNVADYTPWERPLSPSFIELGYNTIPDKSEGPRMWATIKQNMEMNGATFHLVLIRLTPSHLDRDDMLEEPFESYSQLLPLLKSRTAKRHSQLSYCIDKMSEFTPSQIQKANNQPLDYLSPFLSLFQAYFSRNMHQLRRTHWEWLHHELGGSSITQTERDNLIFATWNTARSILEDFSMLTDQLEDYATELGYELSNDTKEASAITQSQAKHRKMLERARNLELHVRDTIQLNVSSLSLRESRRSITQADSIGRITFLAFIFLPLSLVTSFFGMNIQELTGNGFSWKVFGAVTAVLCTLTAMVCLWMWRGRFTWFTWLLYAPIMAPLAISQFLWIIMIEFWDSSVHEMWHGPIGQLVTDWWSLGPFGKIL